MSTRTRPNPSTHSQNRNPTLSESFSPSNLYKYTFLNAFVDSIKSETITKAELRTLLSNGDFLLATNLNRTEIQGLMSNARSAAAKIFPEVFRAVHGNQSVTPVRRTAVGTRLTESILSNIITLMIKEGTRNTPPDTSPTARRRPVPVPRPAESPSPEDLNALEAAKARIPGINHQLSTVLQLKDDGEERTINYRQHFGVCMAMERLSAVLQTHLANAEQGQWDVVTSNVDQVKDIILKFHKFVVAQTRAYKMEGWGKERTPNHPADQVKDILLREKRVAFNLGLSSWSVGVCPESVANRMFELDWALRQIACLDPDSDSDSD